METKARIASSIIICVAYLTVLYSNDVTLASRLYIVGNGLALPYMIRNKCWDIVALLVFFIIAGFPKAL